MKTYVYGHLSLFIMLAFSFNFGYHWALTHRPLYLYCAAATTLICFYSGQVVWKHEKWLREWKKDHLNKK